MKTDTITHTFSLLSTWCHVVCSSPWKQTVPHCSPLIHSLVLPFISSLALSLCFKAGRVGQSTLLTVAPSANIYPLLITISLGASSLRAYSSVAILLSHPKQKLNCFADMIGFICSLNEQYPWRDYVYSLPLRFGRLQVSLFTIRVCDWLIHCRRRKSLKRVGVRFSW